MSREELRRKCEETAEILVPYYQDKFDIELREPDFTVLSHDEFNTTGRMNYVRKDSSSHHSGEVVVLYDEIWSDLLVNKGVAHELGHVAKDINSKEKIKSVEYPKGRYVPCFEEGIANHFRREGLKYLEKYFEGKSKIKSKTHKMYRLWHEKALEWGSLLSLEDEHIIGNKIFSGEDDEIKEALEKPETFFKSIDFSSL
ncbi:MAG: hypothetical protein ACLFQ8_02440 [Candidatus Aenigmatarchaeota archaeon]